jgi:hypothetical protein
MEGKHEYVGSKIDHFFLSWYGYFYIGIQRKPRQILVTKIIVVVYIVLC